MAFIKRLHVLINYANVLYIRPQEAFLVYWECAAKAGKGETKI